MWRTLLFQSQSAHQSVAVLGTISSSPGVVSPKQRVQGRGSYQLHHTPHAPLWMYPEGLEDLPQHSEVQAPSWVHGIVLQDLCCLLAPFALETLLLPPEPGQAPSWLHPCASWAQELEGAGIAQ